MLETMYPAAVNSRQTELAEAIDDTQTSFTVLDGSVLPPAPNLLTLGTDESAETVLYTGKTDNEITGVTRGFESGAVSWAAGTKLARFFTAHDHDTFRENIADLDQRLSDIVIPPASLTEQGIVMLSKSTTGSRDDVAATESAVAAAFQYGVERKAEVVAALNSIGVPASTSESWDSLITKTADILRAVGDAEPSDVRAGKSFSNTEKIDIVGTLPERTTDILTITPGVITKTNPAGIYGGDIIVPGEPNLVSGNILVGKTIYDVSGSFKPTEFKELPNMLDVTYMGPYTNDNPVFQELMKVNDSGKTLIKATSSLSLSSTAIVNTKVTTKLHLCVKDTSGKWVSKCELWWYTGVDYPSATYTTTRYLNDLYIDVQAKTITYKYSSYGDMTSPSTRVDSISSGSLEGLTLCMATTSTISSNTNGSMSRFRAPSGTLIIGY
ncbi:putative tail fiber protein [Paenibacillus sp. FSL R5-192]|uniref:tail fiber protein n=1 Tax=Paenibacillus sp. FSL R5-192 TaxID=1226754 RepID=UPI0003E1F1F4|nr:tail fiber protein [Paenibacillus sp. FSL R5-192]ETT31682.1 putative tail fiber protein [Paenibacillus sp. FSL R5-192]